MPRVIGRTQNSLPPDQTREIRLARIAVSRLTRGFHPNLRKELICELLGRLAAEKREREAGNLNHWEEFSKVRIQTLAGEVLAAHAERVTAQMKKQWKRWYELAWRVTRSQVLTGEAVILTAWELWRGKTREEVACRALVMNARDILEKQATALRHSSSLDAMVAEAEARGHDLDFPSSRMEDQDPLDILIAQEQPHELSDELDYALGVIRYPGNRDVLKRDWWKNSGLSDLERRRRGRF